MPVRSTGQHPVWKKKRVSNTSNGVSDGSQSYAVALTNELSFYEHIKEVDDIYLDALSWWSASSACFPKLAKHARKYLCVSATSVASERVFSTAGNIVTARRNSLTSENVDMLTFLAKNL